MTFYVEIFIFSLQSSGTSCSCMSSIANNTIYIYTNTVTQVTYWHLDLEFGRYDSNFFF